MLAPGESHLEHPSLDDGILSTMEFRAGLRKADSKRHEKVARYLDEWDSKWQQLELMKSRPQFVYKKKKYKQLSKAQFQAALADVSEYRKGDKTESYSGSDLERFFGRKIEGASR